jgi:hypothetical protein
MSNSRMKKLALGLSTAAAVAWSAPADAQVANLQVFTDTPFFNTALELSFSFAATYRAGVGAGDYAYAFLNRAQVCQSFDNGATYSLPSGAYYHEYKLKDPAHPFDENLVHLTGIKLANGNTRTAFVETELQNFVAFVTGTKDSFGNIVPYGQNTIRSYCLTLPRHHEHSADNGH